MIERRHLIIDHKPTTLGLEPLFWQKIDHMSSDWRRWISDRLMDRPADMGRASWIRQSVLTQVAA